MIDEFIMVKHTFKLAVIKARDITLPVSQIKQDIYTFIA